MTEMTTLLAEKRFPCLGNHTAADLNFNKYAKLSGSGTKSF